MSEPADGEFLGQEKGTVGEPQVIPGPPPVAIEADPVTGELPPGYQWADDGED